MTAATTAATTGIGLYHPGRSLLHRVPAGYKLFGMLAAIVGVLLLRDPWQLGIAVAIITAGYALARIPPRLAWSQLRPLRYFLLVVAAAQLVLATWQQAVMVCGTLLCAVAIAALVTLTTRVTDMLDVATRLAAPLRRVGVDPDRVALLLALTIRSIPLLTGIVATVTQARKARGLGFSLTALAVPTVVRALRAADAMGEALIARGVDD